MANSRTVITASPDTDIWRKPNHFAFNAPISILPQHTSRPLKSFQSARITFSFPGGLFQKFDQGGILIHLSRPGVDCHGADLNTAQQGQRHRNCRWLKAGVELFNNKPMLSTVGCDRYADWSVVEAAPSAKELGRVTIEVRRDGEQTLWVYHVTNDGTKVPLREIAWFFEGEDDHHAAETGKPAWEASVGAMAARPGKERSDNLEVAIEDLQVEWKD